MPRNPETVAIARALVSLNNALLEIDETLFELAKALRATENENLVNHFESAQQSRKQALEDVKKLLDILETSDGQR